MMKNALIKHFIVGISYKFQGFSWNFAFSMELAIIDIIFVGSREALGSEQPAERRLDVAARRGGRSLPAYGRQGTLRFSIGVSMENLKNIDI